MRAGRHLARVETWRGFRVVRPTNLAFARRDGSHVHLNRVRVRVMVRIRARARVRVRVRVRVGIRVRV